MDVATGWAGLMVGGIKRVSDHCLSAEHAYTRREVAECQESHDRGLYAETMVARLTLIEEELSRRERLVKYGGPPVRGLPNIKERIDKVKSSIDILAVADLIGIQTEWRHAGNSIQYACPAHGDGTDRNPSGVLNLGKNRWHCFGCNSGGDMFDLLIAWGKTGNLIESLEWLESHCGIVIEKPEHRRGIEV